MTEANPWEGMGKGVQRRAENSNHKSIYWISDLYGRWGISFRGFQPRPNTDKLPRLRGIEILGGDLGNGTGALNLVLVDKDEWELFLALCNNLIDAAVGFDSEEASITAVEHRIKRWQELLRKEHVRELSIERQMGLYTELNCLTEIVAPEVGLAAAVTSWTGADYDRQDFLLDDTAVEVKSHITSKGEIVQISSKYQLDSIKEKLILTVYSLSISEHGDTVLDVVEDIRAQLGSEFPDAAETFENKLLECDFVPELIKKPLKGFQIDSRKHYLVTDDFPRIISMGISPLVRDVRYAIELTHCTRFEIDERHLFDGREERE